MQHPLVRLAALIDWAVQHVLRTRVGHVRRQVQRQVLLLPETLKTMIKKRSTTEPDIGHMKMNGRLTTNPLKGQAGRCALHASPC